MIVATQLLHHSARSSVISVAIKYFQAGTDDYEWSDTSILFRWLIFRSLFASSCDFQKVCNQDVATIFGLSCNCNGYKSSSNTAPNFRKISGLITHQELVLSGMIPGHVSCISAVVFIELRCYMVSYMPDSLSIMLSIVLVIFDMWVTNWVLDFTSLRALQDILSTKQSNNPLARCKLFCNLILNAAHFPHAHWMYSIDIV